MKAERGQATLELALCLPLVVLLLGVVFEIAFLAADQVRLAHAAREVARVAVVEPGNRAAWRAVAASGLGEVDMTVDPAVAERVQGEPLTARLSYDRSGRVPLVGWLFSDVTLTAEATMRIERP